MTGKNTPHGYSVFFLGFVQRKLKKCKNLWTNRKKNTLRK